MLIRSPGCDYADVTPRSCTSTGGSSPCHGHRRRDRSRRQGCSNWLRFAAAFAATKLTGIAKSPFSTTEKQILSKRDHYNNFYEFGTDKAILQETPRISTHPPVCLR